MSTTTAWEAIQQAGLVTADYPRENMKHYRKVYSHGPNCVADWPIVRPVVLNPQTHRLTFWSTNKPQNIPAALIQVTGALEPNVCKSCSRANSGIFVGCVTAVDANIKKITGGACANCYYNGRKLRCEFHRDAEPTVSSTSTEGNAAASHPENLARQEQSDTQRERENHEDLATGTGANASQHIPAWDSHDEIGGGTVISQQVPSWDTGYNPVGETEAPQYGSAREDQREAENMALDQRLEAGLLPQPAHQEPPQLSLQGFPPANSDPGGFIQAYAEYDPATRAAIHREARAVLAAIDFYESSRNQTQWEE